MTPSVTPADAHGIPSSFWYALLANMVWINVSEIFRYFVFVMPMMREAIAVDNVAPMSLAVFVSWGLWDTILVCMVTFWSWLALNRFGTKMHVAVTTGTALWLTIFVILWLGLYNMNLATAGIAFVALPLAWLEMVIAALIVRWFLVKEPAP